jgi:hypothetical protein
MAQSDHEDNGQSMSRCHEVLPVPLEGNTSGGNDRNLTAGNRVFKRRDHCNLDLDQRV